MDPGCHGHTITFTNYGWRKLSVPTEASLCHIIKNHRLLLQMANGGISKGKWNGPGGKFEQGETLTQNVVREVMEETSLRIIDPTYQGKIEFYMNGGGTLDWLVHVFLVTRFSGRPRSSAEGEVRWFDIRRIPYAKMWDDDRYWLPLLLNGIKFNARFFYDRWNKHVVRYEITSQPTL
jgi:8-oxo-dGTP diphosphatase